MTAWGKIDLNRDFEDMVVAKDVNVEDSELLLQQAEAAATAVEKNLAKPRTGEELIGVHPADHTDAELKQQMALTKEMSEENPGYEEMFDITFKVYEKELKKRHPEKESKKGGRRRKTKKRKGGKKKRKTRKKKVNKRKTRRKSYKKSSRKTKRRR
jgi:hypothetical protein